MLGGEEQGATAVVVDDGSRYLSQIGMRQDRVVYQRPSLHHGVALHQGDETVSPPDGPPTGAVLDMTEPFLRRVGVKVGADPDEVGSVAGELSLMECDDSKKGS